MVAELGKSLGERRRLFICLIETISDFDGYSCFSFDFESPGPMFKRRVFAG